MHSEHSDRVRKDACAGTEERRANVAQILAGRIDGNVAEDDGTFEEVLCKVAALYQAAYTSKRNDGDREMTEQEMLIRMALPWHMAPRQLAALIAHGIRMHENNPLQ